MHKLLALLLFSLTAQAQAGPFIDLGLGYATDQNFTRGRSCMLDYKKDTQEWGCSKNILGYASIGYEYGQFTVAYEHWSSLQEYDAGLNIVSIKYRIGR